MTKPKYFCCSEYPEDGYMTAKDIEEAKRIFNCAECDHEDEPDCRPMEMIVIKINGKKFLRRKDKPNGEDD